MPRCGASPPRASRSATAARPRWRRFGLSRPRGSAETCAGRWASGRRRACCSSPRRARATRRATAALSAGRADADSRPYERRDRERAVAELLAAALPHRRLALVVRPNEVAPRRPDAEGERPEPLVERLMLDDGRLLDAAHILDSGFDEERLEVSRAAAGHRHLVAGVRVERDGRPPERADRRPPA